MHLSLVVSGRKFSVYALVTSSSPDGEECAARQFMKATESDKGITKSLTNLFSRHAHAGPIYNKQQSRELKDGIYEFKTRQGARVLWFYASERRTILTHGFMKGDPLDAHIERAIGLRELFLAHEQQCSAESARQRGGVKE